MTTNDPTEDPDSVTTGRPYPTDEQIEADVNAEKTADLSELPEGREETQLQKQQAKDPTEAEPPKKELPFHFAAPKQTENVEKDEGVAGGLHMEEEAANVEEERIENPGDVQNSGTGNPDGIDNLESDDKRATRMRVDPTEQQGIPLAPARSKEAVQDPHVVDIAPTVADDGVIDVDTFDDDDDDDDVSDDDESEASPTADETMTEVDNANEPPNDETQRAVNRDGRSEPIDLTVSPPLQSQESPMLPESDEKMITEEIDVKERHDEIRRQGVIDVDEQEGQDDENVIMEEANRKFDAEDMKSPPAAEDDKHVMGTTDTETVSADLISDGNGEDVSPGEVPDEATALEAPEGEAESRLSLDRAGVTDHNEEEERSAGENRTGSEDDALELQGQESTAVTAHGTDFLQASTRKLDSRSGLRPMTEDESEDDESEDGVTSEPHEQRDEGNEGEEDGSPSAPSETTGSENEGHEKAASTDNNERLVEEIQDKGFRQHETDKLFVTDLSSKEATFRLHQTDEKIARPSNDNTSGLDPKDEDDVTTVTGNGDPQPAENMETAEQDTSKIEHFAVRENTMVDTETGDVVVSHATRASFTPDSVSIEPSNSKEVKSSTLGSDLLLSGEDSKEDSGEGVTIGSAKLEKDPIRIARSAAPSTTRTQAHASKQQSQGLSGEEKGTERRAESVPVHHVSTSNASEAVKQTLVPTERSPVEESKSAGTGHLAPMFGIQLSRPIKSGPVSFSSPPSFPRYSLNPQAVPFFPAKPRKTEGSEQPTDASEIPSGAMPTPSKVTKVAGGKAPHATDEKNEPKEVGADNLADKSMKTVPTLLVSSSSTAVKSHISVDKAPPPVALKSAKQASTEASAQFKAPINFGSAVKPLMLLPQKNAVQKKVSFAPTPTEIEDHESERKHAAEAGSEHPVHKERGKDELTEQPTLPDANAEREKELETDKGDAEIEGVKEKQTILQVQTDEGLRREVKNVTVAMREGNSKARPEKKKFTVRLTTGTEEKAKLQFFKVTGPSLKLYVSLDATKENLRVRKVTNRRYVVSVAKMAPPGDDAADVIVKYFLHFEEQDTFEEMYSQCVANLQKKPKPTVRTRKTDERSNSSQTGNEVKHDTKRLSPKNPGMKRSAETVSVAQVSKKSKLLADKKKLLDKMAALRKKKEQKGTSVVKGHRAQSSALASIEAPKYDASDKDTKASNSSYPMKVEDVENKPKSMEVDSSVTQGTQPIPIASKQPPRKRIAEDMSKQVASKRVRLPGMQSTGQVAGITRALPPDGKPKPQTMSLTNMRGAAKEQKEPAPDTGNSKLHDISSHKPSEEVSSEKRGLNMDTLKKRKSKESEAFQKVTRDLKQSTDEKNALKTELDSRNRLLDAEREKSLLVQRESSDAWQRIAMTIEALSVDMRRLRREDTDRCLESLARCEASSSEDFFDRLHTFRPSTWAAFENSDIGAMECALRGWYNCGPGKIKSSEGAEVTLSESFDDADFRQPEIERVRSLLREGHCLLSGWIGQSCPESFRTLEGSQRMLTKEELRANVEDLRGLEMPETKFEWGASALLLSDDICEKLAVYNWRMDGECLRCSWCNQRIVIEDESRFDAMSKHYAYCPFRAETWKSSVLRNATVLGIEGDGDAVMKD